MKKWMLIGFGCIVFLPIVLGIILIGVIPYQQASILRNRYQGVTKGMSESELRSHMGELVRPVVLESPPSKIRMIQYPVHTLPFKTTFIFKLDENNRVIGRHIHDYD